MEWGIPNGRQIVAAKLGQSNSDVFIRAGDSQSHLYDQHDWVAEYDAAKNHQKSGDVSIRWSGFQDSLSRLEKYQQTMDNAHTELERSDESIRYIIWKPIARRQFQRQFIYTNYLTRSHHPLQ